MWHPGSDDQADFYAWSGPRTKIRVSDRVVEGPANYHRFEMFQSFHPAPLDQVAAMLPTNELAPVRWFDGRAVVLVAAMRYHEVGLRDGEDKPIRLAPYGEVMVGPMVSRRAWPRGVPAIASTLTRTGVFVLDLPVTTAQACELGREVWNFPKYVADMDFREEPGLREVRVSEGDQEVLRLDVRPRGRVWADTSPAYLYSAKDGALVETRMRFLGHYQRRWGRAAGRLSWSGSHPTAQRLTDLGVSADPLFSMSYLDSRAVLPPGEEVGLAFAYDGHRGRETPHGRLTVAVPGLGPIHQNVGEPGWLPEPVREEAPLT